MKYLLPAAIFVFIAFSSCKKSKDTWRVQYKVSSGSAIQNAIVRYRNADGSTSSADPTGGKVWNSPVLEGFQRGDLLSFSLENNGGNYKMIIFLNDSPVETRDAGCGGTQTLESSVPQ